MKQIELGVDECCIVFRGDGTLEAWTPQIGSREVETDSAIYWTYVVMGLMGTGDPARQMRSAVATWWTETVQAEGLDT